MATMNSGSPSEVDPFDAVVESYLQRYRRGECPSLTEYAERYPELADRIRETFPALAMIEELGPVGAPPQSVGPKDATGPPGRLGDYRLLRVVGRGGMGIVYEAMQESLGRHVALKLLPSSLADQPLYMERFQREARAAARLHHTNIVPVFGVGQENGSCYYAMQFIHGQGLDLVLQDVKRLRGPMVSGQDQAVAKALPEQSIARSLHTGHFVLQNAEDPATSAPTSGPATKSTISGEPEARYFRSIARLGLQAAEALAHAHDQGVLHRDIKPSNLLLDVHGTLWVTDFGLAKADDSADLTRTGDIVGTVRYMAPERFKGKADARSDVYALAVTLYEMLALQPPFSGRDQADLIGQITEATPAPLPSVAPAIPRDLETIVAKAMARDPDLRYATATSLADDLRAFLENRPIRARRATVLDQFRRWCRRNPAVAGLSAGLAAMVLLLCAGSIVAALRLGRAAGQAQKAERDTKEQLYHSLFVQAHANRTSQRPGQRLDSLKALAQAARLGQTIGRGPQDLIKLRSEAIACLALPDAQIEHEWEGSPPGTTGLAFDAHGQRYAWGSPDGRVHIRRLADHSELLDLPMLPAEVLSRWTLQRFSADGRFLAIWYEQWGRLHPLEIWELKPGVSRPLVALADATGEAEFSPDGQTFAVGLPDQSVGVFDLASGREVRRLTTGLTAFRLAFHPDGHKLAVAGITQARVQVHDLESGRVLYTLSHPKGVQALAWHPEGRLLASGCDDRRIYLWELRGCGMADHQSELVGTQPEPAIPQAPHVLEGHTWEVRHLAFNGTGNWLASFGFDMTLRLWDVATRRQLWHVENVRVLGFHRGEQLLASCLSGRRAQVWSCLPSAEFHLLRHPRWGVLGFAFSPDARWLAMTTLDGSASLWDVACQRRVSGLEGTFTANWDPAGNLFTVTREGQLVRRTFKTISEGGLEQPLLGPPEFLLSPADGFQPGYVGFSADDTLWVLHREPGACLQEFSLRGTPKKRFEVHVPNAITGSVSPDHRWAAVGTQDGGSLSIFDAHTGKLERILPIGDAYPWFSPDSRWLVTTTGRLPTAGGECCLWRPGTWEKVLATPLRRSSSSPGSLHISPDSKLLAVAAAMSEIRLMRLDTLEEIATLEAPEPGIILVVQFSGDGRYLAAGASNTIHLWDLHRLRRSLREIGLDWEPPPPEPALDQGLAPLQAPPSTN
jgi:serine/threonine protein kinase/WD40 repeat protein